MAELDLNRDPDDFFKHLGNLNSKIIEFMTKRQLFTNSKNTCSNCNKVQECELSELIIKNSGFKLNEISLSCFIGK
jgi:hypothetical protein